MKILIAGVSTRAIAESAFNSGYNVMSVDYFGDMDQKALVPNISFLRDLECPFTPADLSRTSAELDAEQLVFIANLENHPQVVKELAEGRILLGNPPPVLTEVRNWKTLQSFCQEANILFPTTLFIGEESNADPDQRWLIKPIRGGGGHDIREWQGEPLAKGEMLQSYQPGQPASIAFVADGERSVLLGLSEQLIGQAALGTEEFRWCGNILPLSIPSRFRKGTLNSVRRIVDEITKRFELRGLNGMDLVFSPDGSPWLIEVNPRYTASMELLERAYELEMFDIHVQACHGILPDFDLEGVLAIPGTWSKGIVFAERDVIVPDTKDWTLAGRRDIPFPGDRIGAKHPICTLFSKGADRKTCWEKLVEEADILNCLLGDSVGERC